MTPRELAILERFLRAEAMAKYALRSAREGVPADVAEFMRRQELEEEKHQSRFEAVTGIKARERETLPRMPRHWHEIAVQLLGYESLGWEFANLAAAETSGPVREMIREILLDETGHVRFYEESLRRILAEERGPARGARVFAAAFLRRLPTTIDRYLRGADLGAHRDAILEGVRARFRALGLLA